MWKIKTDLIKDLCNAAQNYYPKEFMCLLGGDKEKKEVTEIVLLPTYNSEDSASLEEHALPIDDTIIGTMHSHPNSSNYPSQEDKKFFTRFSINIIAKSPYSEPNTAFYNEKGEKVAVMLV